MAKEYQSTTIDRDAVKPLEDWVTLPEAAERMGFSRQALHNKISRGTVPLAEMRRIGTVLVISKEWVDKATQ